MMAHASPPALDPRFNSFLFAQIGEDRNGLQVSLLSALARLGLDPWQEAQTLADMPEESARQRLDALIAKLPGVPSLVLAHRSIAERLIALLPRLTNARATTGTTAAGATTVGNRNTAFIVFAVLLLVGQALMASYLPSAQNGGAVAPISAQEFNRN